tara:strand:+ start:117 stop:851 length:735 start_codon:yes stop_codon:yes gene_type:complete
MRFIKVILFFCVLNSPVNADNIYHLIKIPNLKIYELNTSNKLKYFYAAKPFRLGVKKNIKCLNSDKETLLSKYNIIHKNLSKYSYSFLKKINLKYIVLCENLSISGINTAGIPDNVMKTLILDIKFDKNYFERVIHHEVFHIINDQYKEIFNSEEWNKINEKSFKYTLCSTCSNKTGLYIYKKTNGFLTEYSKSTASEDMAEIFSHLIFNKEIVEKKINNDPILKQKVLFIKKIIFKIDSNFIF